MLLQARGGEAARFARLLAFFTIGSVVIAGCRSTGGPLPAPRYYVRLDSLLTLHPAWSQVTALDQQTAQFSSAQQQAATLRYATAPLPQPFAPPETVPANLAKEREKRVKEDARRYIVNLERSL